MRNIQIAICDDEKEICRCLEEYITEYGNVDMNVR